MIGAGLVPVNHAAHVARENSVLIGKIGDTMTVSVSLRAAASSRRAGGDRFARRENEGCRLENQ
jgi:hypothetical protein